MTITEMSITELSATLSLVISRLRELAIDEVDNDVDWMHIINAQDRIESGLIELGKTSERLGQGNAKR